MHVFDQVGVHALAVADGRLEADRVLDEVEELTDTLLRKAALLRQFLFGRLTVELLSKLAARAHEPSNLVRDVDRQPDRSTLVGERARYCLTDPPRRVRRELVAELVIELLDGANQAEVPFLDQIQERHAGLRVVPGDRHDEPEVRLDQLLLGLFVSLVLAARELALFRRCEERAVADRADIELERILGRLGLRNRLGVVFVRLGPGAFGLGSLFVDLVGLFRLFGIGNELELGLELERRV